MTPQAQLNDLQECANKLSVEIIYQDLNDTEFCFQSGYCKVNGTQVIILDKKLPIENQIDTIIHGLENVDLEDHFIPPWIRDRLQKVEF